VKQFKELRSDRSVVVVVLWDDMVWWLDKYRHFEGNVLLLFLQHLAVLGV